MSDNKDNVVKVNFGETEAKDIESLIEKLRDIDFDDLVIIGTKDEDAFMIHTGFKSRMKMIGSIEGLKLWLWAKGYGDT